MKHLYIILGFFIIASCQPTAEPPINELTLEEKKVRLQNLKKEALQLNSSIKELDAMILKEDPEAGKLKKTLVTTLKPEFGDFDHYVEIQGGVEAKRIVGASSELGGRLITMLGQEGNYIRQGALLASVGAETFDRQRAELETALSLARTTYERQANLWKQNIGSEMQYLQAKNRVESIEQSLATLQTQKAKVNVYAPISGIIQMVNAKAGEVVAPGQPIVQIINTATVKVIANLPESLLGKIRRGKKVLIKFPSLEKEVSARVSRVGATINPENRTFEVEVQLPNRGGTLKPNLLAYMLINDESVKDAVSIPTERIQQDVSGQDFIYVIDTTTDGHFTAVKRTLMTGLNYEGQTVVEEGLAKTDVVIDRGFKDVDDGGYVNIQAADPSETKEN